MDSGLQNVLYQSTDGAYPFSFAEMPSGTLLCANGIDPMIKWDPLAGTAATAGVRAPEAACALGGVGPGTITGLRVAFVRFIDRDGNPSDLSPVSNEVDCGRDGPIADLTIGAGLVTASSPSHGLADGDAILISGVAGLGFEQCNSAWLISRVDADTFTIPLTLSSGTLEAPGAWTLGIATVAYSGVPVPGEAKVARRQILRNLEGDCDVLYVDVDTTDLTSPAFASTRSDEDLSAQEALPLNYGDDDLPYANRHGVPPSHKAVAIAHQGRAFAAADVSDSRGHAEAAFGATVVRGVGTSWRATYAGRLLYLEGAARPYEIASVDEATQTLALTQPYFEPPVLRFLRYTIRPAPGERRLVYFSEPGNIEAWPAYNALALPEDSDRVTGLLVQNQFLYVVEQRHVYRLTFQQDPLGDGFVFLAAHRGCVNDRCHVTVEGVTYMLDEAGLHAFDGESTTPISEPVQNIFQVDGLEAYQVDWGADQSLWHAAHDPVRGTIRWFVAFVGQTSLTTALCYNYRQKRYWIEVYPAPIASSCTATLGFRRSLAGTEARRVLCLAEGAYDGVDGTGTLYGFPTSATAVTLTDAGAAFEDLEGAPLALVEGKGRGQMRMIASNDATTLTLRDPWDVLPDATTTYQVGGIEWAWRSGWFALAADEASNPRDVEIVYDPLDFPSRMDLALYYDHEADPRVWDYTQDDDGRKVVSGSPYISFALHTLRGYQIQRLEGRSEPYAWGDHYVSVALSGTQGGGTVRLHEVVLSGAEETA